MATGVIKYVDPIPVGAAELTAPMADTDNVGLVDDAAGFSERFEEARYLTIGDDLTPHQYVAVENDAGTQQSFTLAADVGVDYEASLPVYLWDPTSEAEDKRAIRYQAQVRLDGQDRTIPVTIRHTLIPLAGVSTLEGATAVLARDEDGDWYVVDVTGRQPQVDGRTIAAGTLPDLGGSGQTFSEDPPPETTDGFDEGHGWWQVDDLTPPEGTASEVLGFWRATGVVWVLQEVISGQAAYFQNALINALQVTGLTAVHMQGGSIFIAQGESASEPESFSGTSLPGAWTSTKVGPDGTGSAGSAVPGVSVVSSGPTGQVGSALLLDLGVSGLNDATSAASGEVYTSIGDASNAEISTRFRSTLNKETIQADTVALAIRSQGGAAFSTTWDAVTLELVGAENLFTDTRDFAVKVWTNGSSSTLGVVKCTDRTRNPTAEWFRAKLRVLSGQVAAKVWRDGATEPAWTTFEQSTLASPGRASLVWQQYPTISNSRGQDVWLDEFNVTTYATGFSVNPDGFVEMPLHTQRGRVSSGTLVAGTFQDVAVTFPSPFSVTPVVTCTPIDTGGSPLNFGAAARNVTQTGFTARFERTSGTASFDAAWAAGPPS